ncbi:MAG: YggS family pyridoxal phosphate enzyme [Paenibacillus sp. RIFOXYA1_FULL_44_5]|nr:MAG: YggS family pyridoxal phosphate enzyme [Paenibacillus sp. RIFOXYA1_FULL_44_5]
MDALQERIIHVEERIQAACDRSGRSREEVQVIAVTKYVSLEAASQVLLHGLQHVGENRWQDAKEKWEALGSQGTWHFIGHLQTNKVKDVFDKFHYIHSLDRLSLAQELQKNAEKSDTSLRCFIQVNVSGEESKYGLAPEQLFSFAEEISHYDRLQIIGLMAMAPHVENVNLTRSIFRGLRDLRDSLNEQQIFQHQVTELSMGMSNDFEIAIEEGSTWVRLGSVLVGKNE